LRSQRPADGGRDGAEPGENRAVAKPFRPSRRVPGAVERVPDRAADGVPVPDAFDDVFREHYEAMVRALTAACGDREVAADAVQDAFVRAYTRWRRLRRYDDPVAWVRRVALNRIRDHFRRTARGRVALARLAARSEPVPPPPDPQPGPTAAGLLAGLPEQQRTAAALFYVEQLSVREVAASMGVSEGAVKYHLHAARRRLRDALEATADG
jgi:RNA polymerase sigma-70 factor (ECF subfamily)